MADSAPLPFFDLKMQLFRMLFKLFRDTCETPIQALYHKTLMVFCVKNANFKNHLKSTMFRCFRCKLQIG